LPSMITATCAGAVDASNLASSDCPRSVEKKGWDVPESAKVLRLP
jgi:hypothetical protein